MNASILSLEVEEVCWGLLGGADPPYNIWGGVGIGKVGSCREEGRVKSRRRRLL